MVTESFKINFRSNDNCFGIKQRMNKIKTYIKSILRNHRKQYVFMIHHVNSNKDENTKRVISGENLEIFITRCLPLIRLGKVKLTFDDGYSDIYKYVKPLCVKHDITCTIFICPSLIGKDGYLTKEELLELADNNVLIQSHLFDHINVAKQSNQIVYNQLKDSKEWISRELKSDVFSVAYPWGQYSFKTILTAKKLGYTEGYAANEFRPFDIANILFPKFTLCRTELTNDNVEQWIKILEKTQ